MQGEASIGRKATTAAIVCALSVSLTPAAALAVAGSAAESEASASSHSAAASMQDDGSSSSASSESGSSVSSEAASSEATGQSGQSASSASSESGESSSQSAESSGSSAGSGEGEQSGSSESSGASQGSSDASSSASASSSSSGSSASSGASDPSENEGQGSDDEQIVLDLAASTTTVTVTELQLGKAPKVMATFAGSSTARDLTKDPAFEMTYFGPEGGKTTTFDAAGTYSLRVSAASRDAKTKAGELVKGRSPLILFTLEKEKPADEAGASSASAPSADNGANSSAASSPVASATTGASGQTTSASSAKASSSTSSSSSASSGASTARRGVTYTYNRGGGGGVTYLAPVRITSSGTATVAASMQGTPAAVWSGSSTSQTVAVYSLDDKATDVSALVAQANGAELLFWGGGIELAPQYIWTVDTSAMTRDDAFGLDLRVAAETADSPVLVGAKGVDATALRVEQVGQLPSGLELFWRTSSVFFDGEAVDVYRFDPKDGAYVPVAKGVNTADGYVSFKVDQGGEYLVVEAGAVPGAGDAAQDVPAMRVTELAFADEAAEAAAVADAGTPEAAQDEGDLLGGWAIPTAIAAALAAAGGVWLAMRRKIAGAVPAAASAAESGKQTKE